MARTVMKRRRRRPFKGLPFNKMIPNILTLLALCAGLTAIRFGLEERWGYAVFAILVAGVLDGLDGRVARLLKGASKFGAELDSLSDFISFGVAPALVHYSWTMKNAGGIGWVLVCLFAVCMALRLARFNTLLEDVDQPVWAANFFVGVPAPAAAGLVVLPIVLSFQFGEEIFRTPQASGFFLLLIAALMVSRVPTYSFKRFKVPAKWVLPTMLIVGLLAASLVSSPWETLSIIAILYLSSIPLSIIAHRRLERLPHPPEEADAEDELSDEDEDEEDDLETRN